MKKELLTQLSVDVINNSALSWQAKGLFIFMAHGPLPELEVSKKWLLEQCQSGFGSTTSAMRELEARGLIKRICRRSPKAKFQGTFWRIA